MGQPLLYERSGAGSVITGVLRCPVLSCIHLQDSQIANCPLKLFKGLMAVLLLSLSVKIYLKNPKIGASHRKPKSFLSEFKSSISN